ncbi:hypothetical protein BW14_06010 [Bifidobacterium sp. UTBIF-68]|uniref:hypothetical protein n=1 Tax=Bifidobacterium sp. UTBIF-68 TaxID=1465262 RepID=UPI0011273FF4|nr:hypothetical protein [Bifidobacterium sp. UTBIF-68]TPF93228.1 hypothetical protein BW14_06010 [Bifidobacterium sp. UTBIF-68]
MSIISREAARRYPRLAYPGYENPDWGDTGLKSAYTSDDMQEAYIEGAQREWTDTEIDAGAERLFYKECSASGLFFNIDWDRLPEGGKAKYRSRVRGILAAIRAKATEEDAE